MTDIDHIQKLARRRAREIARCERRQYFKRTINWFAYLGLIKGVEVKHPAERPTLNEALRAGEVEPRILELLPALIHHAPFALKNAKRDMPQDLEKVLLAITNNIDLVPDFRKIPPQTYLDGLIIHYFRQ